MGKTGLAIDAAEAELRRYQMEGQDIPWLLALRAEHRAAHPAIVWDPPEGTPRTWTYRELWDDVRRLAAGLHARGEGGRQGPAPRRQLPGTGPGLARLRHGRSGRGDHQHQVRRRGGGVVRREGPVRGGDHPAPNTPRSWPPWVRPSRGWRSPSPAGAEQASALGDRFVAFDELLVDAEDVAGSGGRPDAALRASCSPRARRRSPRPSSTRTPTPSGPAGRVRATSTSVPTTATSSTCPSSM